MGERYLIDTNIVSKSLDGLFSNATQQFLTNVYANTPIISIISKIELLGWNPNDDKFAKMLLLFVSNAEVLLLTDEIVDKTIEIRKKVKIKLPDAIIAATAIVHNLTLLSANDSDFLKISKLKYKNPS